MVKGKSAAQSSAAAAGKKTATGKSVAKETGKKAKKAAAPRKVHQESVRGAQEEFLHRQRQAVPTRSETGREIPALRQSAEETQGCQKAPRNAAPAATVQQLL